MNYLISKEDSILRLNKEELEIKQPKRKPTNFKSSNMPKPEEEPISKKFKRSITKFQRKKTIEHSKSKDTNKSKDYNKSKDNNKSKDFSKPQIIQKKFTVKVRSNKKLNTKKKFSSNQALGSRINIQDEEKNNINHINTKDEEKINLRKVENEIFTKIKNLKINYQDTSLIEKEIFDNDLFNKTNSINESYKSSPKNFNNNKKQDSDIKNNFSSKNSLNFRNNFKNSSNHSINNLSGYFNNNNNNISNNNEDSSPKFRSLIVKNVNSTKFKNEINKKSFNFTDINKKVQFKDLKNSVLDKKDRARHLVRSIPLYDSFDDDESEKDDDFHGNIISPKSNFILYFDFFLFLSVIYCLYYIPLRMARSKCFCNEEHFIHKLLLFIIDLLYICDFSLSFFRGYYNFQLKLVKNNAKIFLHYLKTDFLFDLIESIPIFTYSNHLCSTNQESNYCFANNMSSSLIYLKIITNLKIIKIFKVKNKQKNLAFNYFFNLFSENYSLEKSIDNHIDFLFCILAFHFFVCLNIFLSRQTYPNWINIMQLQDKPLIQIYIASSYSLIETLTTVGYGDAVCQCEAERIFQIIILGVGVIAYSYLISAFGNLIKNENQSSIKHLNNLKILEEIRMEYPNMSFKLYKKIYNHIESRNKSEKKADQNILTNSLPFNLKNAILLVVYNSIIKNFKFFKNCENSNFIIQVLSKVYPSTSKKNEFLLFEGEMIEEIIFVKDGRLSLEAAIDMDDPELSIQRYFTVNFQGITSEKEMRRIEDKTYNSKVNSRKLQDFDNVKFLLNTEVKKQVNNLLNEGCEEQSILDRTKFDKKDNNKNRTITPEVLRHDLIIDAEGNYKFIKVLDIRKNENYGGLYMFRRRPSPLSLKVRSKFVELYLLPKKDIFAIAKNHGNIWNKIYTKEFHNMISIKHKTFNILNKFIEENGYGKVNPIEISKYYSIDDIGKYTPSKSKFYFTNSISNNSNISPISKRNNSGQVRPNFSRFRISNKSLDNTPSSKSFYKAKSNENNLSNNPKSFNVNEEKIEPSDNTGDNNRINEEKQLEQTFCSEKSKKSKNTEHKKTEVIEEKIGEFLPETLNNIFTEKKALEIKEQIKKSRIRESRRKIFSFGKKTAELFRNRNFTIVFNRNNPNDCFEINNKCYLSSKTIVQDSDNEKEKEKETEMLNNYMTMFQNKSFLDKINEIDTQEDLSFNHFDKNDLISEKTTSFSLKSIYKNINVHTNMKYSQNISLQNKTLSFLDKLIKNENKKRNTINTSSLSDSFSQIKKMITDESNIIKKNSISLSRSNSSYKEILNLNESIEKNVIRSEVVENTNFDKFLNQNKIAKKKDKNKPKMSPGKKSFLKAKNTEQIGSFKISPKKSQKRFSYIFNQYININLEDSNNNDTNINYKNSNIKVKNTPKKRKKKQRILSHIETKKKNKDKDIKKGKTHVYNNNIKSIKKSKGLGSHNSNENLSPVKSSIRKSCKFENKYSDSNQGKLSGIKNTNQPQDVKIYENLLNNDNKKIDKQIKNSGDYFSKAEKEEECIII